MSFKANPTFAEEVALEVREKALRPAAERAAGRAEALAHSAMPRRGRKRITVGMVDGDIAVINTNHGGHLEEFGSKNNPPYSPLRRGVRAAGLKLR